MGRGGWSPSKTWDCPNLKIRMLTTKPLPVRSTSGRVPVEAKPIAIPNLVRGWAEHRTLYHLMQGLANKNEPKFKIQTGQGH